MSLASSVASPAPVVVTAIVDLAMRLNTVQVRYVGGD